MKQLIFIFLLATSSLFSQTDATKKVVAPVSKTNQELLQGTWTSAEKKDALNYQFKETTFFILKGDSVLFTCNNYILTKKSLDTNCPGKEKLVFRIKSVSDSTLFMKSMSSDYWHKYVKVVQK